MAAPSIRAGFPIVADHAAAVPPYDVLTDAFTANAGDELVAFVIGPSLPTLTSRNADNTGAGSLVWIRRYVCRANYITAAPLGVNQLALYTAVVPAGGVTERALYAATAIANDGNQAVTGSYAAGIRIFAADNTNGVGAVGWGGSIASTIGSTANQPAALPIRPFAAESLLLAGLWVVNGNAPTALTGCTEVVAPGTNRMPVYSRVSTAPTTQVSVGSAVTNSTLWALGLVEFLPLSCPKPGRKLLCLGTSGVESNNANYGILEKIQDDLAPNWEIFNQGVFWSHTGQIKARWDAEKATYPRFDAVVIHAGSNDLADYSAWNTTSQANLQAIYDDVAALGLPAACYAQMSMSAAPAPAAPARYYEFRDWVHAHAPAGSLVYDYHAISDPAQGLLTLLAQYNSGDSIHISAAGGEVIGAEITAWLLGATFDNSEQWYLTKYDVTSNGLGPVRTPAICRYFPVERSDVAWAEVETVGGGCLVKVRALATDHATIAADPDFAPLSQLIAVNTLAQTLGYTSGELASGTTENTMLQILAAEMSDVTPDVPGTGVIYGTRRSSVRTISDIEAYIVARGV